MKHCDNEVMKAVYKERNNERYKVTSFGSPTFVLLRRCNVIGELYGVKKTFKGSDFTVLLWMLFLGICERRDGRQSYWPV